MTLSDAQKLIPIINRADYVTARWFVDWLNIVFPLFDFQLIEESEWVKGNDGATVTKISIED